MRSSLVLGGRVLVALGSVRMSVVHSRMAKNDTRRNFLQVATLAAGVSIPLTGKFMFAAKAGSGDAEEVATPEAFQLFTAEKLAAAMKAFQADPGEHYLYQPQSVPLTIAITAQGKKSGGDFEWHEGRDHVFLILEGATKFEVGGTPKDARKVKPGEWLSPASEGATHVEVKKGDMFVIPRGMPHRQSTDASVTWMLISSSGSVKT